MANLFALNESPTKALPVEKSNNLFTKFIFVLEFLKLLCYNQIEGFFANPKGQTGQKYKLLLFLLKIDLVYALKVAIQNKTQFSSTQSAGYLPKYEDKIDELLLNQVFLKKIKECFFHDLMSIINLIYAELTGREVVFSLDDKQQFFDSVLDKLIDQDYVPGFFEFYHSFCKLFENYAFPSIKIHQFYEHQEYFRQVVKEYQPIIEEIRKLKSSKKLFLN